MLLAGHATRIELYGSLLLVVIVVSLMCERMAIDRCLIDELIRDRARPAIIQENRNIQIQQSPKTFDDNVRDVLKKQGFVE